MSLAIDMEAASNILLLRWSSSSGATGGVAVNIFRFIWAFCIRLAFIYLSKSSNGSLGLSILAAALARAASDGAESALRLVS
jgi:hypothetical protein